MRKFKLDFLDNNGHPLRLEGSLELQKHIDNFIYFNMDADAVNALDSFLSDSFLADCGSFPYQIERHLEIQFDKSFVKNNVPFEHKEKGTASSLSKVLGTDTFAADDDIAYPVFTAIATLVGGDEMLFPLPVQNGKELAVAYKELQLELLGMDRVHAYINH